MELIHHRSGRLYFDPGGRRRGVVASRCVPEAEERRRRLPAAACLLRSSTTRGCPRSVPVATLSNAQQVRWRNYCPLRPNDEICEPPRVFFASAPHRQRAARIAPSTPLLLLLPAPYPLPQSNQIVILLLLYLNRSVLAASASYCSGDVDEETLCVARQRGGYSDGGSRNRSSGSGQHPLNRRAGTK